MKNKWDKLIEVIESQRSRSDRVTLNTLEWVLVKMAKLDREEAEEKAREGLLDISQVSKAWPLMQEAKGDIEEFKRLWDMVEPIDEAEGVEVDIDKPLRSSDR